MPFLEPAKRIVGEVCRFVAARKKIVAVVWRSVAPRGRLVVAFRSKSGLDFREAALIQFF